ncbi:cellulose synthase-like protein D3 [Tanacetum coccineum]
MNTNANTHQVLLRDSNTNSEIQRDMMEPETLTPFTLHRSIHWSEPRCNLPCIPSWHYNITLHACLYLRSNDGVSRRMGRNEQFWLIGGTSTHLAAVLQGLLKVVARIEISFTLTSKSGGDDNHDEFADLYIIKWSSLMIPPIVIIICVNLNGVAVGGEQGLAHRTKRKVTPTIVFVWAGLIASTISLLVVTIHPPDGANEIGGSFQFP